MGFYMKAAGAGFSAGAVYKDAKARRGALDNAGTIDLYNAQVATDQSSQALRAGQTAEAASRLRTASVYSEERAGMAANGVDLGTGSATEVLAGTKVMGEQDALTIRDNAAMTAWGYQVQANNFRNEANAAFISAKNINPAMSALGSLLGSSGSVAQSWYGSTQGGTTTPQWYQNWMGSGSAATSSGADVAGFMAMGG